MKHLKTYKLFEFERREKKDGELIKNIFESSNYCIFDLLSGKDIEDMFPSTINYVHPIYNNIFIKKEVNKCIGRYLQNLRKYKR
mgnify:CR=1 FL=1